MAQQVKFYSVAASDTKPTAANGIIFVDNGELYKGTQRFGLGRVTVDAEFNPSTSTKDGQARGDIVVTGTGAGWVFDGTSWISIGGDIGTITSAWQADISRWTAGLAVGDANSYITSISQAADGKVTATAVAFPALDTGDNDGEVKLGTDAAKVSGWDDLKGRVSAIETIVDASTNTVTATTGSFTELTVTSTATFSATTVSATSLTVNGSTVEQIADARISNATLTGNITAPGGTDLVNEGQVVTYVSAAMQSFDNAMHYVGTTSDADIVQDATVAPDDITGYSAADMKAGDIVLKGTSEYIWNGTKWELIGDQGVYATKAELSASWSTLGTAAFQNFASTVDANATTLPTCDAVVNYVSGVVTGLGLGDAAQKSVANTLTSTGTSLPTESAVAGYVTTVVSGLDASVSSSENNSIQVGVTQVDGVVTAVTADLVWLNAGGAAIA